MLRPTQINFSLLLKLIILFRSHQSWNYYNIYVRIAIQYHCMYLCLRPSIFFGHHISRSYRLTKVQYCHGDFLLRKENSNLEVAPGVHSEDRCRLQTVSSVSRGIPPPKRSLKPGGCSWGSVRGSL